MEDQDILIKNKEAELAGLKLECLEKAEELTSILISIDSAKKERIDLDKEKADFEEYCTKIRSELKAESDRINVEKTNLVQLKETSSKELEVLRVNIKTANKELSLANDRVFGAKAEYDDVIKKKDEILLKVAELNLLVEMLPKLQSDILELEGKRNKLRVEISEMLDASTAELTKAKEDLVKITKEVEIKVKEAEQAEYRCKTYVDELYTHMNNYQVVKDRLESIYKTKFPELDLKI